VNVHRSKNEYGSNGVPIEIVRQIKEQTKMNNDGTIETNVVITRKK